MFQGNNIILKLMLGQICISDTEFGEGSMLLELEKLHVVEDANGGLSELERTRKQKDILDALEKV